MIYVTFLMNLTLTNSYPSALLVKSISVFAFDDDCITTVSDISRVLFGLFPCIKTVFVV